MTSIEPDNMRPPPHHSDDHPAVLTSDSARQGPKGWRVLYVLIGGLVSCLIIAAIYLLAKAASP